MTQHTTTQVIATRVRGCLIVTLPADLLPEVIDEARRATLENLHRHGARVVVLELSAVQVMDQQDFESLRSITLMARLLGARTLWVGLRAGIVLHLVDNDVDTTDIEAMRDLEEALLRADADSGQVEADEAEGLPDDEQPDYGAQTWSQLDDPPAEEPRS